MTHISYETYNEGGHLIEFWLKPAVVALGVPLYLQLETIKKQLLPITCHNLPAALWELSSVAPIAKLMGASDEIISLPGTQVGHYADSHGSNKLLGGIPSLTAAVVVCVGLWGGILGFKTMKLTHIGSPMARPFLGSRRPRGRNFHCHGHQPQIRRIRQPRPDPERYLHSIADPNYPAIITGYSTKSSYFCYL